MEDSDLWRLAAMLIQKHGDVAESYARVRADEALQDGNNRACERWKNVAAAVYELEQRASATHNLN
jgi:hypothetical protein